METRSRKRKSKDHSPSSKSQMSEEPKKHAFKRSRKNLKIEKEEHHLSDENEEEEDDDDMEAGDALNQQAFYAPARPSESHNRFTQMLTVLNGNALVHEKLATLADLSEFLSMATEDTFTGYGGQASGFRADAFVRALLAQFNAQTTAFEDADIPPELALELGLVTGDSANPELMILACRCLSNLIEALPSSSLQIIHHDGVQVLVQKLLSIEYIDLAESILSILDKMSGEYPTAILKGNGLMASLQYIDFFNIHVQRTAISIAANACRGLASHYSRETRGHDQGKSTVTLVKEIMPILERLITYSDARLLENAVRTLSRIVEWAQKLDLQDFESIVSRSLVQTIIAIASPQGSTIVSGSPVIFTMLIKTLACITKISDSLTQYLLSDLNLVSLISYVLSGSAEPLAQKATRVTAVMNSVVNQPSDLVISVLTVASDILPNLPVKGIWDPLISTPTEDAQNEPPSSRLQMLQSQEGIFEQYLGSLMPIFIDAFGITVNPAIRRRCLECISKGIWHADSTSLEKLDLSALGKFMSDLIGLSQNFLTTSTEDKETVETRAFVAAGLSIAHVLLHRQASKFRKYFRREGVLNEMDKLMEKLENLKASQPNVTEPQAPLQSSPTRRDMESVITNLFQDLSQLEERMTNREGSPQVPSTLSSGVMGGESHMAHMMNDMRHAFESMRREESLARVPNSRKNIRSVNGHMFTQAEVEDWMIWICRDILAHADSQELENDQTMEVLVHIRDALNGLSKSGSTLPFLHRLATCLVGKEDAGGLTGYELIGSGLVQALISYLSRPISAASDITKADDDISQEVTITQTESLQDRVCNFYHIFLNGPSHTYSEDLYVPEAFETLVARLQESLSRSECLIVATAVPQGNSTQTNSVFALLSSLAGMGSSKESNSPSLQLARQIRIKLVAEDPSMISKHYQAMIVSIHAVATFKALEEYLKSRFLINESQSGRLEIVDEPDSEKGEHMADQDHDADDDWDEDEIEAFDEDEINVSDMLIQSEEDSRKNRPRADSLNSQKSATSEPPAPVPVTIQTRDSVVEFHPETPAIETPKIRTQPKRRSTRNRATKSSSIETPPSRSYANITKSYSYTVTFSVDGQTISRDSTIFGALYKYEQSKLGNPDSNPNIWNQVYEIKFKKMTDKKSKTMPLDSLNSNSDINLPDAGLQLPFNTYNTTPLSADIDTQYILQLLGILNDLNSKSTQILPWSHSYPKIESLHRISVIPSSLFVNSKITAKLNRQLDEPLIVASRVLPSWCSIICQQYSFLVPFETRLTHLQSRSFGYSRNMARWQQQQQGSNTQSTDGQPMLGRIQRQKVRISRDRIIDSMVKVMDTYGSTQALLEVEFFDEVGTGLGPTLEFFALVCQEYRKVGGPRLGSSSVPISLWRSDAVYEIYGTPTPEYLSTLFPQPITDQGTDLEKRQISLFKALGTLVAKALLDSRVLDMPFSPVFLEMVVFGHAYVDPLAAIQSLDPSLHKSIKLLQEFIHAKKQIHDDGHLSQEQKLEHLQHLQVSDVSIDDLCLDFTLPGYPGIELIPDGKQILVSIDNVEDYVDHIVEYTVGRGIRSQVRAFRKGFNRVFPVCDLHSFSTPELTIIMGGSPKEDWSEELIKECLHADHGYNKDSRIISDLSQMLSGFSTDERRLFLQFATGCPRLPYGGFKGLNPPLTVVRKTASADSKPDDYLPSVMTCVNYLKIPEYSSSDIMKSRFLIAMREGQGCFHLS